MNRRISTVEASNGFTEHRKDEMREIKPFECFNCGAFYDAKSWEIAKKEGKCHFCHKPVDKKADMGKLVSAKFKKKDIDELLKKEV